MKKDVICGDCWSTVFRFHELYLKVECSYKKDLIIELNPKECVIIKNEVDESDAVAQKYENDLPKCVIVDEVEVEDEREELPAVTEKKSTQRKKTTQKNVEKKKINEEEAEAMEEVLEETGEDTDNEEDEDEEESEDNYNDDEDYNIDDHEEEEKPTAKSKQRQKNGY